jgi:hypothetical protein
METLLKISKENLEKAKEVLFKDDIVSRASITYKIYDESYYFLVSGTDEQCERAKELTKELSEEVGEEEKAEIIKKIKEEEERAIKSFGDIFK